MLIPPRASKEMLDLILPIQKGTSDTRRRGSSSPEHHFHVSCTNCLAGESDAVSLLTARIWTTDCFTTTLGEWLRKPVRYVSTMHEVGPVASEAATRLGIEPGSSVTYRRGYLEITAHGEQHVVADVRAVVAHNSLDPEEKLALESRTVALGHLLGRRGVCRRTHTVTRASDYDDTGGLPLKITATLIVNGNAVAVVDELVYDHVLTLFRPVQPIVNSAT